MEQKYPRTFHLPWSPGVNTDDKKLSSVQSLLNCDLVITEKLDGGNSCLTSNNIFARSHNQTASHPSFDLLKQTHSTIKHELQAGEKVFGENCRAVHSITYESLPTHFFVFNILKDNLWLSWSDVEARANVLGLSTVPVLWRGQAKTASELQKIVESLTSQESVFGGPREGVVVRAESSLTTEDFTTKIGKWVRAGHVQTDEHWTKKALVKQKIG